MKKGQQWFERVIWCCIVITGVYIIYRGTGILTESGWGKRIFHSEKSAEVMEEIAAEVVWPGYLAVLEEQPEDDPVYQWLDQFVPVLRQWMRAAMEEAARTEESGGPGQETRTEGLTGTEAAEEAGEEAEARINRIAAEEEQAETKAQGLAEREAGGETAGDNAGTQGAEENQVKEEGQGEAGNQAKESQGEEKNQAESRKEEKGQGEEGSQAKEGQGEEENQVKESQGEEGNQEKEGQGEEGNQAKESQGEGGNQAKEGQGEEGIQEKEGRDEEGNQAKEIQSGEESQGEEENQAKEGQAIEENQEERKGQEGPAPETELLLEEDPEMESSLTQPETDQNAQETAAWSAAELEDFDYLLNHYFVVDSDTSVDAQLLDAGRLLSKDFSLEKDPQVPQILIYHTHSQEFFVDSDPADIDTGIVGIGDYLTELLEEWYGYQVIHERGVYDLVDGVLDRSAAYDYARAAVEPILEKNPTIEVVIDLHRDGVEGEHFVTEIAGKQTARIMFFNGLSRDSAGVAVDYLYNPYIEDNLGFSLQLQLAAEQAYPGFTRNIYLKGQRFNLHLRPRSLLVESGTQLNTIQEERNAMEALADILNQVLEGQ